MIVSIPFKRETISKVCSDSGSDSKYGVWFQFPSNGKPYPKFRTRCLRTRLSVLKSFNSLQTGNHIQRHRDDSGRKGKCWHFNSLQTGNHIQRAKGQASRDAGSRVSIPFKRETISKVALLRAHFTKKMVSFNSLQTGNHIQSYITIQYIHV